MILGQLMTTVQKEIFPDVVIIERLKKIDEQNRISGYIEAAAHWENA